MISPAIALINLPIIAPRLPASCSRRGRPASKSGPISSARDPMMTAITPNAVIRPIIALRAFTPISANGPTNDN